MSTPLPCPWSPDTLSALYTLLANDGDPAAGVELLQQANPNAAHLAQLAVAHVVAQHWLEIRHRLAMEHRTTSLPWRDIAAATALSSEVAAQRHFTRAAGTYRGYTPTTRRRPRRLDHLQPASTTAAPTVKDETHEH